MKPYRRTAALLIALAACLLLAHAHGESATPASPAPETLTLMGDITESLPQLGNNAALRHITLYNCPAVDLTPLTGCKNLQSVTIRSDAASMEADGFDLTPLARCGRLRSLTLQGPCVDDLTPLTKMQTLTTLSVSSLAVEDYTPITALRISHLRIAGAPAEQMAVLFHALGKRLESAVIGDCTLSQAANDAILQSTKLSSLRFERVDGINTNADAWTGLKNLTGLQMLDCRVDGLAFLKNYIATVIVKLEHITIGDTVCSVDFDKYFLETDNVPSDAMLAFIGGSGCRWLYATVGMETETVSPALIAALGDIGSLLSLDVQAVSPEAFTAANWYGFPKLEQLKISGAGACDAGFLPSFAGLRRLTISHTAVANSEAIGSLTSLKQLSLLSCTLDSWSFAERLVNLELFTTADSNGPVSLDFTQNLKQLDILALENAPVTDLSPLTGHTLSHLYLYGCPIDVYSPLATLRKLSLLSCNEGAALPGVPCRILHQRMISD